MSEEEEMWRRWTIHFEETGGSLAYDKDHRLGDVDARGEEGTGRRDVLKFCFAQKFPTLSPINPSLINNPLLFQPSLIQPVGGLGRRDRVPMV